MRKIILLIIFVIYSSSLVCAIEAKTKTNTESNNISTKLIMLEEEIKNVKNIIDLNNQNNKELLQSYNNHTLLIDNIKYYINSLLIILGIVVTIFVAILGIFIWKENKKSREAMLESKKDYERAQELYEKSIEKLEQCSDKLNSKIEEFDKLCKEKEKEFDDKLKKKEEIIEEIKTKTINKIMKEQEISMLLSMLNLNLNRDDFNKSLQISENILRIDNNNKWGYYGKAVSLSYLSHSEETLKKALDCITKAIKIDGSKHQFLHTKASIFVLLGKFNEALNILKFLPDSDTDKISNEIEINIMLGDLKKAKQRLLEYKNFISNNNDNKITYGILYSIIESIENLNIDISKKIIEEYISCIPGTISWSSREINENLILKQSYLTNEQKNNLMKIIDLIEHEKKQRKIKRKIDRL